MKGLILSLSHLPFWILHRVSDALFVILFYLLRYRRKVVQGNLRRSFPEYSEAERARIERKFYRNFCDIMIETIKYFSITREEFRSRCCLMTPDVPMKLKSLNLAGISSHLGNWDTMALAMGLEFPHQPYAVYKPLSNQKLDLLARSTRERFGTKMIPMKSVRNIFQTPQDKPFVIGLLSDQAPHDYAKAFHVQFLNQKTYVVPGPGLLTVQYSLTPIWGWIRRVGRSRFEWGVEWIDLAEVNPAVSEDEAEQITRVGKERNLSTEDATRAFLIVREYCRRLETQIRKAPEDWLWSHRRWKER